MAGFEPGAEPLRRQRDRVGAGDADQVESQRPRPLGEGALERLPV